MMNIEDVQFAARSAATLALSLGATRPERASAIRRIFRREARLNHILFLSVGIEVLFEAGKTDKAMRWLGFVQGALWWATRLPIEEFKLTNKPRNEA